MKSLAITVVTLSILLTAAKANAHENMNYLDNLRDRIGDKRQEVRYDRKNLKQLTQALKKENDPGDIKMLSKQIVKASKELTKDTLKLDKLRDRYRSAKHHRRHR